MAKLSESEKAALVAQLEQQGIMCDTYDAIPLERVHKYIADRLTHASQSVPSFPLEVNVRLDKLLAARASFNAGNEIRLTLNDLLIKACAMTLKAVPEVNASYTPQALIRHSHADIAMAVATDSGLITPIIRQAERKSVAEISVLAADLAQRAHARQLRPEEYTGGTFTISNLGMFGIARFGSIINPPHGAILSVGAGEQRVIVENGTPTVATMMSVVLTCDHRVIDGALGARWLKSLRALLEEPSSLLG